MKLENNKKNLFVSLDGGLGNQLFQFAMGFSLSKKLNMKLILDISNYSKKNIRKFELYQFKNIKKSFVLLHKQNYLFRKFIKIYNFFFLTRYNEKNPFIYDSKIVDIPNTRNIYVKGYFQSEKYFASKRFEILNLLKFNNHFSKKLLGLKKEINETNSVAIHIRRGDYLNYYTGAIHGVLNLTYYKTCISFILDKVKKPKFFIFSDDVKWVKRNNFFSKLENSLVVDTKSNHKDLELMSFCKYFIIANSSFSWWGAWLSGYKNKIVCAPKKWLNIKLINNDLLPKKWKRF
jgi:hypothetical protein